MSEPETLRPITKVPPELLREIARELTITNRGKRGEEARWAPTDEQMGFWRDCYEHDWVLAFKPRQVFYTTAGLLDDLMFTIVNTRRGHRIETWLIWDTDEKVLSKLDVLEDWCQQLKIEHKRVGNTIEFPRGGRPPSVIRAFTAGGKRTGASLTAHRIHASEVPFYENPAAVWASLDPSLVEGGCCVVETTMDMVVPKVVKEAWDRSPANGWHRHFLSVEKHSLYRSDPAKLPPEDEDWMRDAGFTNRETMAWLSVKLWRTFGGDRVRLLREYPATIDHLFMMAEDRWVRARPEVLPHRNFHVGDYSLKVYVEPERTSGQVVLVVDTAGGTGNDGSTIVGLDKRDGRLVCSFKDNRIQVDELATMIEATVKLYTLVPADAAPWLPFALRPKTQKPHLRIESNAIGEATVQACRRRGLQVDEVWQDEASKYRVMLEAKRAVEAKQCFGPSELVEECESCHRHKEKGTFEGPKDLLMSIGMGYDFIGKHPYRPPEEFEPHDAPRKVDMKKALARRRKILGMRRVF
jgi:hypothetical protein